MITISVCMIVKNEEKRLAACLDCLVPIADEIIIVDTGSVDKTKEIARKYTDSIFDFKWIDDFSAARNFAFSKATMDYIYTADADELIDSANVELFKRVKAAMLPEVEIVQMYYLNLMEHNTAYNSKRELRPKLFKRLRSFEWTDPIHETIRLDPVIYNSDIEIRHMAEGHHAKRDLAAFVKAYERGVVFSHKLHSMYAKELFIAGDKEDLEAAVPFFEKSLCDGSRTADEQREARCVLARTYRLCGRETDLFRLCLREAVNMPCSEMCSEIGHFFFDKGDMNEAYCWLYDAVFETEPVISVYVRGSENLRLLAQCCKACGRESEASEYEKAADEWQPPETV